MADLAMVVIVSRSHWEMWPDLTEVQYSKWLPVQGPISSLGPLLRLLICVHSGWQTIIQLPLVKQGETHHTVHWPVQHWQGEPLVLSRALAYAGDKRATFSGVILESYEQAYVNRNTSLLNCCRLVSSQRGTS